MRIEWKREGNRRQKKAGKNMKETERGRERVRDESTEEEGGGGCARTHTSIKESGARHKRSDNHNTPASSLSLYIYPPFPSRSHDNALHPTATPTVFVAFFPRLHGPPPTHIKPSHEFQSTRCPARRTLDLLLRHPSVHLPPTESLT